MAQGARQMGLPSALSFGNKEKCKEGAPSLRWNDVPYSSSLRASAMVADNSQIQVAYTSRHSLLHNAYESSRLTVALLKIVGWLWVGISLSSGARTTEAVLTCNTQPCGRGQKHKAEASHAAPLPLAVQKWLVTPTCTPLAKKRSHGQAPKNVL